MSRLTEKNAILFQGRMCGKTFFTNIYKKLGKLEDLEEQLGCPLDVVFKALKEGCHIKDEGYFECPDIYFHLLEMEFVIGWANKDNMGYELLKDYQKNWWLKGDKE